MEDELYCVPILSVAVLLRKNQILLVKIVDPFSDAGYEYLLPFCEFDGSASILQVMCRDLREGYGIVLDGPSLKLAHSSYLKMDDEEDLMNLFFVDEQWKQVARPAHADDTWTLELCDLDNLPEELAPHHRHALAAISEGIRFDEIIVPDENLFGIDVC